jgi:MFS family permease
MTGPTLGGILVTAFGWPSIFLVNLPIGLIGFFASRWFLPDDVLSEIKEPFDWAGAILFASGMSLFLWGLTQGEQIGWTKPVIYGPLLISVLALVVFLHRALTTRYPIIDLSLFKNWIFLGGNLAGLVSFISMFATTLIMPFYMKGILHFQEMHIGLMMTPFPLAMAIVAPISGWLSDRLGYLILTTSGLLLNVVGLFLLSTLDTQSSSWLIACYMATLGVGMGLFQSPNNSSVMGTVPPQKLGIAGGVNALVRNVGMVTGIAFSVSLLSYERAAHLEGILAPTAAQQATAFVSSMSTVFHWAAFIAFTGIFFSFARIKEQKDSTVKQMTK